MKKLILFTALSTALLSMSAAHAGGKKGGIFDDTSGGGATLSSLYGGAAIGGTFADNCTKETSSSFDGGKECERDSGDAWKIYGGYKFMPNFAVEGAYIDFGNYSTTETVSDLILGPQITTNSFDAKGVTLMGVASAAVTDDIEVFGKLGVIHWERDTLNPYGTSSAITVKQDSGTDLALGVGAAYKLGDNFAIRGEAEHFDDIDVNLFTLGGTFSTL